jgi:hypothetical protein
LIGAQAAFPPEFFASAMQWIGQHGTSPIIELVGPRHRVYVRPSASSASLVNRSTEDQLVYLSPEFHAQLRTGRRSTVMGPTQVAAMLCSGAPAITGIDMTYYGSLRNMDRKNFIEQIVQPYLENIAIMSQGQELYLPDGSIVRVNTVFSGNGDNRRQVGGGRMTPGEINQIDFEIVGDEDLDETIETHFTSQLCYVCESPAEWQCRQCKSSTYCSPECQKVHWSIGHYEDCH